MRFRCLYGMAITSFAIDPPVGHLQTEWSAFARRPRSLKLPGLPPCHGNPRRFQQPTMWEISGCLNDLEKTRESRLPEKRKNKPCSSRMAKCRTKQFLPSNNRKFMEVSTWAPNKAGLPLPAKASNVEGITKCRKTLIVNLLVQSIYCLHHTSW